MFKKVIITLAVLIAMPVVAFAQKFGVVDNEAIVTAMPEFISLQTEIETISKKHEEELKNLQDKFNREYADFQALGEDTPQSIRERRMTDLNEQEQKIQQYVMIARQDIEKQQQTKMEPILKRAMEAITAVGNEGGFVFIFDKNQPAFTGADVVDVTPLVKSKLGL